MQASHGPYYAYFSLFLHRQGYADTTISQLWALGVVAEIIVFLYMSRLLARFSPRTLLLASLALATLRWLMIASEAGNIYILSVAQTLHLASFGVYHAVAIHLIHRHFGGRLHGRGQALYSSIGFGAGGAAGSLAAGWLWSAVGPASVFYGAALAAGAGLVLAFFGLPGRGAARVERVN
jgi:PPP family 3-phenylpropionic acid transporter